MKEVDSLALSKEILNKENILRIPVVGFSMLPFLNSGDIVIIKSANEAEISIGDIILRHIGERMIAHRLIKKRVENNKIMLMTKGDSHLNFDPPVPEDNIMGKVIAIEKTSGTTNLESKTWRITNYVIARYSVLSLLIYRGICFLKRVLIGNRENRFVYIGSKVLFFSLSLPPKSLINFLCIMQRFKSKLKPNTA